MIVPRPIVPRRTPRSKLLLLAAGLASAAAVSAVIYLLVGRAPRQGATLKSYAKIAATLDSLPKPAKPVYLRQDFIANWSQRLPVSGEDPSAVGPIAQMPGALIHRSEIIVQIKPSTPPKAIAGHLAALQQTYQLELVGSVSSIGVILLRLPADAPDINLGATLNTQIDNVPPSKRAEARRAATLQAIADRLTEASWVQAATPNTVLTSHLVPTPGGTAHARADGIEIGWDWGQAAGGFTDTRRDGNWGLKYMNFPAAWNFRDAIRRRNPPSNPASPQIGVLDNGFGPHEDLSIALSPITLTEPSDHGFHVAGIIGASWNGAIGIEGCVPDAGMVCATVRYTPFVNTDVTQPLLSFNLMDAIATTAKFLGEHPSVRVINISLGYNWISMTGINPNNHPDSQKTVRQAGRMMRMLANIAREQNTIIVSAAGNDSRPGSPSDAQWASPFNWAALNPMTIDGVTVAPATNIVVVESIGRTGTASWFSNVHGCVAAPGEKILSTVWTSNASRDPGAEPHPATAQYAPFDGTSMAAPHITGLIGLMCAYHPSLTVERVLEIIGTNQHHPTAAMPAPTLNAFDALVACRPDSLKDLADLNNDGKVDLQDFAIFKQELKRVEGAGAAANLYLRTDLNGSGRLSRDPADRRPVGGVPLSDLDVMIKAWDGPPPDLASLLDR